MLESMHTLLKLGLLAAWMSSNMATASAEVHDRTNRWSIFIVDVLQTMSGLKSVSERWGLRLAKC